MAPRAGPRAPGRGWRILLYVRYVITNFDAVVPSQVHRSAQPQPEQLAEWIRTHGLKTTINLCAEGPRHGGPEELAVAERPCVNAQEREPTRG